MAIIITALPSEIEDSITQALEGVNNACLAMRQRGLTVLLPASLDFELSINNGSDTGNNTGTSTKTDTATDTKESTEKDAGVSTSVSSFGDAVQTSTKEGGGATTTRSPIGTENSTTTITHPAIRTDAGGGDGSKDITQQKWEKGTGEVVGGTASSAPTKDPN